MPNHLVLDWDKTLSPVDMQSCIMQGTNVRMEDYWGLVDACNVTPRELATHQEFIKHNQQGLFGRVHTKQTLAEAGRHIPTFPGVGDWLRSLQGQMSIHIVTAGTKDFLTHHPVASLASTIHGGFYIDDELTQIGGIITATDKVRVIEDIAGVDHSNVIFIGDGWSDYWAMKSVVMHGGYVIGVWHDEQSRERVWGIDRKLGGRLSLISEADYTPGSKIDTFVKRLLNNRDKVVV